MREVIKRWIKKLLPAIECGLHSGFPICCILFYVSFWRLVPNNTRYAYIVFGHKMATKLGVRSPVYMEDLDETVDLPVFNRIPCPFCLFFSAKEAKHIACNCGKGNTQCKR